MPVALSNGDVILLVVLLAVPIAAIAFIANAGNAFKQIGKGDLSVQFDSDLGEPMRDSGAGAEPAGAADDELRQLLEAKAYRQQARGEQPLDVDAEFERLQVERRSGAGAGADPQLREEVRQLVVARNERRARQGKEQLDVDAEIERQLADLENLGQ